MNGCARVNDMTTQSPLIHPRLMRGLLRSGFFNSRATFQIGTTTFDSFNQPTTAYADDPLLKDKPCYIEPISGGEARQPGATLITNRFNVIVPEYLASVINAQETDQPYQVVIDQVAYNIIDVASEDTHTLTAIVIEKVHN